MNKHLVFGTFGTADLFKPLIVDKAIATPLPLLSGDGYLIYGIGRVLDDLNKLKVFPSELGLDFLILACHVYTADTRISRKSESQDSWTREIAIIVPVSDTTAWHSVKEDLVRMLNFLTGDKWTVDFRARPNKYQEMVPKAEDPDKKPEYNILQLFSGGLDSLIGAIDNLERGQKPLFISHAGDGATSDAQTTCYDALRSHHTLAIFERLRLWMNIPHDIIKGLEIEDTTRGRSFLFFALGICAGTGLMSPFILQTPENGLIALNVPLDILRLGSLSTHTTHPYYMQLWNQVITKLGMNGKIENPYWDLTKGEMVQRCLNPALLQQILPDSLSCSSPAKGRWQGLGIEHCGYCLPCVIRRASLTGISDNTTYTLASLTARNLDTIQAEGQQIRSFQMAIRRLKKNLGLAKLLVHKSGPLAADSVTLDKLSDVYRRGMLEVDRILMNVVTEPAD